MIRVKRVYDAPDESDGFRVLVDRLWPRGLSKEKAKVDLWLREVSPSDGLRKWYSHDPRKWDLFRERYAGELSHREGLLERIGAIEQENGRVTLLFGSKEPRINNAVALQMMLESRANRGRKRTG